MTAITLTPDEAAVVQRTLDAGRDVCHLVVKGNHISQHADKADCIPSCYVPPQHWVNLAGPCERCNGSGVTGDRDDALDCPRDCTDGRKLIELRKWCDGPTYPYGRSGPLSHWSTCVCHGFGTVLLAHATVEVQPGDGKDFVVVLTLVQQ